MTDDPNSPKRGLLYVLAATAIAGGCGYLIQLLAPALLDDPQTYVAFAVFWSTVYLFGAAVGGVQQEVTRATHPVDAGAPDRVLSRFALIGMGGILAAGLVVGWLISPVAFSADPVTMTAAFAIGISGYFVVAVLTGALYGLEQWRAIAVLVTVDAVLRAVVLVLAFVLNASAGVLALLIAIPFPVSFLIVWVALRRRLARGYVLDVEARRLVANAIGTAVAAAATGIMVTGLPLLLRATMPAADPVVLASLILIITITRAPLIIPVMALQNYLIVDFRRAATRVWTRLLRYVGVLALGTVLLAAAAWLWGPALVDLLSSGRYTVDSPTAGGVVLSAGLVALMCVTGPALLSEQRHRWFVTGWVVAALLTIAALFVPLAPVERTLLALLMAPAAGLAVHLVCIGTARVASVPARPAE